MNNLSQFSRRQLFSLATMILLVPMLRFFATASAEYAGKAAWLTGIAAAPFMLLYMYFISDFIDCRKDGENLQELILRCLGLRLGRVALVLSAAWLLLYSGFILRSGAERLIITIYPSSSPPAFTIIMGLVCLLAALGNPRSIVRSAMLIKPVVLGAMLLVLLFALFSLNTDNIFPVSLNDALPVLGGSLAAVNVLSFAVYAVCFIEGMCPNSPGRTRQGSVWLLSMVAVMTLLILSIIGMFGAELSSRMSRPFFIMVRNLVFFRTVERVEALVVMLWLFPDFLLVSIFLYAAQYSLRLAFNFDPTYTGEKLLNFQRGRWLIWLGSAAAIVCSLFIGPDAVSLEFWSSRLIPLINLSFAFIFLPLVYITGKLTKKL